MIEEITIPSIKFSIIIAVYNGVETLGRCLDSIVSQTYPNIELIIMDAESTDGTVNIIKANESIISYWESKPDRGIYHAWNKALDHVSGDWVYFLGTDDLFYDETVLDRASEKLLELSNEVKLAYGKVSMFKGAGDDPYLVGKPWCEVKKQFFVENTIPHQGLFHRSDLFLNRKFDESFAISGDYEFISWAISESFRVSFLDDLIIAKMQHGGVSSSPNSSYLTLLEFSRARKKHGYAGYTISFFWILIKAYIKKLIYLCK